MNNSRSVLSRLLRNDDIRERSDHSEAMVIVTSEKNTPSSRDPPAAWFPRVILRDLGQRRLTGLGQRRLTGRGQRRLTDLGQRMLTGRGHRRLTGRGRRRLTGRGRRRLTGRGR